MFLKKIVLSTLFLSASAVYATQGANSRLEAELGWLYLKPMSNNHTYAYDVAGTQPYYQDWHAQAIDPAYTSAFQLALEYAVKPNLLAASLDWIHLASNDSSFKQGNQTTAVANIEFVAPPFEMSPPVFGVRRADAQLKYNYDTFALSLEKLIDLPDYWMSAKVISGINILRVNQNFSTVFSDLVGAEPTPYSTALPPDPSFSFQLHSISEFIGLGPTIGLNGQLALFKGLKLTTAALGSLNVGTTSVQENFRSTSQTLTDNGIGVSQQQITTPNKTQIVPGFDGKLGILYQFENQTIRNFSVEAGYRLISYMNAISTTTPQTLVQPGTNPGVPEFSTGTMAIVSIIQQDRPFNLNGVYVTLKVDVK